MDWTGGMNWSVGVSPGDRNDHLVTVVEVMSLQSFKYGNTMVIGPSSLFCDCEND